jgi:hypothetical protein
MKINNYEFGITKPFYKFSIGKEVVSCKCVIYTFLCFYFIKLDTDCSERLDV